MTHMVQSLWIDIYHVPSDMCKSAVVVLHMYSLNI